MNEVLYCGSWSRCRREPFLLPAQCSMTQAEYGHKRFLSTLRWHGVYTLVYQSPRQMARTTAYASGNRYSRACTLQLSTADALLHSAFPPAVQRHSTCTFPEQNSLISSHVPYSFPGNMSILIKRLGPNSVLRCTQGVPVNFNSISIFTFGGKFGSKYTQLDVVPTYFSGIGHV